MSDYQKTSKLCTPQTPCFCTSSYYIQHNHTQTNRRLSQDNGQFSVTWNLDLAGKEFLLESSFLKAAFEQSIKDYINNDILCSDDLAKKGAEFLGVEINDNSVKQRKNGKAVSGNGKCRGDLNKCKVPLKVKRKEAEDDDIFFANDRQRKMIKATHTKNEFCDIFLRSTIFDSFKEKLITAAFFNYDVDVNVINDLEGSLDLKYDVTFQPTDTDGLNQIDEVALDVQDPVPINPVCGDATQCSSQRGTIREIFNYFGILFDEDKHECLHQGINCNTLDMVTHIWIGMYYVCNQR